MDSSAGFLISGFGDEISPDLGEQLSLLASNGVGYLELRSAWGRNVLDLTVKEIDRAAESLAAMGMRVSAIASPIGKIAIEEDFQVHLARFHTALERARQFDTHYIRVFSFYVPRGEERKWEEEVVSRLTIMAEVAERTRVTLLLENDEGLFGDSPSRLLQLVTMVDSPALRLVFDPGNFVKEGLRPFDQAYPLLAEYVEYIHVKDARLSDRSTCLPGRGDGQIPELLADLRARGFRGFLSLEPHLSAAGKAGGFSGPGLFTEAIRSLKNLIADQCGGFV